MFDYGNKAGKQLAWVLSNRLTVRAVSTLRSAGGEIIKDIQGKLEVFPAYYQELYGARGGQQECWDSFFAGFELPLILLEQVSLVETTISIDEIAEAMYSLQSNKSPGPDGLMAELYKKNQIYFTPKFGTIICGMSETKKNSSFVGTGWCYVWN